MWNGELGDESADPVGEDLRAGACHALLTAVLDLHGETRLGIPPALRRTANHRCMTTR